MLGRQYTHHGTVAGYPPGYSSGIPTRVQEVHIPPWYRKVHIPPGYLRVLGIYTRVPESVGHIHPGMGEWCTYTPSGYGRIVHI